jgi:hypothetical protein
MFASTVGSDKASSLLSVFTNNPRQTGLYGSRVFIKVIAVKTHPSLQPIQVVGPAVLRGVLLLPLCGGVVWEPRKGSHQLSRDEGDIKYQLQSHCRDGGSATAGVAGPRLITLQGPRSHSFPSTSYPWITTQMQRECST